MLPDQWDQLGWHQQRALLEGLEDEGLVSRGGAGNNGDGPMDLTSASDDDFGGLGIPVEYV